MSSNIGNHLLIQELYSKACNFARTANFGLFSAHQLNRKAAELVSMIQNPVKRFNENHLALSIDVAREPEIIIYMHIERNDEGIPFLTFKLGKNRYVNDVPDSNKYVAYRLIKDIGLEEDIGKQFKGVKNIYTYRDIQESTPSQNNSNKTSGSKIDASLVEDL